MCKRVLRTFYMTVSVAMILFLLVACGTQKGEADMGYENAYEIGKPQKVEIVGYEGDIMEPFISRDGKYLFFNSLNDGYDTCLYWAEKITEVKFEFRGKIEGVNGIPPHLDAVASMDSYNRFYFISTRDYPDVFENVQTGCFEDGSVSDVKPVAGDFYIREAGNIVMDAEISSDGETLYICNAIFNGGPIPEACCINIAARDKSTGEFMLSENSSEIMKNINMDSAIQYAPSISPDSLEIYFTRIENNEPIPRIYVSRRIAIDEPFQNPELAGIQGFVEAVTVSGDGELIYYHKKEESYFSVYMLRIR